MFLQGFWVFFPGLKPKAKISENIDFTKDKSIFSRVRRFKIDQKSKKTRSWRLKFVFGGQKLAMMSILEAKKTILEAKIAILEAKRVMLEPKMEKDHQNMRTLEVDQWNGGGL